MDNIYVNELIITLNLNQMKNKILTQKILFAVSLIAFVAVIAAVVVLNATRYGMTASF